MSGHLNGAPTGSRELDSRNSGEVPAHRPAYGQSLSAVGGLPVGLVVDLWKGPVWEGILSVRRGAAARGAGYLLLLKPFVQVLWSARWPVIVEGSAIVDGAGVAPGAVVAAPVGVDIGVVTAFWSATAARPSLPVSEIG